jgi:hypothetical protein
MRPARRRDPFAWPPPSSKQAFYSQFPVQDVERETDIHLVLAGEDVGNAILAQARQMGIRDPFRQHGDNRIAADIGASQAIFPCASSTTP